MKAMEMRAEPEQLSGREADSFKRNGFVVQRGLFDPQRMREISAWIDEVAAYPEAPGKHMIYFEESGKTPGERLLSRVENFYPYHAGLARLIASAPMRGRVSELFGETAVLFKDKINFKLPGSSGFTPHQDVQAGWDAYAGLYITALVSIDSTTLENGCLELAAGQHNRGLIGSMWKPLDDEDMRGMTFAPYPTEAGDAIFFDSYCPHRSGPNLTDQPRRVLYITYNRASEGDHRIRYYADKRKNYPPDCEREAGRQYVFRV